MKELAARELALLDRAINERVSALEKNIEATSKDKQWLISLAVSGIAIALALLGLLKR